MKDFTTVVITEAEYRKGQRIFEEAFSAGIQCIPAAENEQALASSILDHRARHAIVGVSPYREEVLQALPAKGVLARFGSGFDNIDLQKATERGILCTNTPHAVDDSVAEFTICLLGSVARVIPDVSARLATGIWLPCMGSQLTGKSLAIIGAGGIGCRVARIAANGFGMNVIGCKRSLEDASALKHEYGFSEITTDFDLAVADANFVSLHLPSNEATCHFIDRYRLLRMREDAWLINTSRGSIVNEADLFDAVEAELIGGAALDVFETEPYTPITPDKDLRELPNILMTPHVASSTFEACAKMARTALQNIQLSERGEYGRMNLLNPEVLTREKQAAKGAP